MQDKNPFSISYIWIDRELPGHTNTQPTKIRGSPGLQAAPLSNLVHTKYKALPHPSSLAAQKHQIQLSFLHNGFTLKTPSEEPDSTEHTKSQPSPSHLSGSHCIPASAISKRTSLRFICSLLFLYYTTPTAPLSSPFWKGPSLSTSNLFRHCNVTI